MKYNRFIWSSIVQFTQSPSFKILFFQGAALLCSFISTSLLLNTLGQTQFGLWMLVFSITNWLTFLDGGITNGLRNKLLTCLVNKKIFSAIRLVSSVYTYFFIFIAVIGSLLITISLFVPWDVLLNIQDYSKLNYVMVIAIFSVLINVFFMMNSAVAYSFHCAEFNSCKNFIYQAVFLSLCCATFLINKSYDIDALLFISISLASSAIISNVIGYQYLFERVSFLKPRINKANATHLQSIFGLSGKFFILQLSAIILYSTDAILVSHLFDVSKVGAYNISNKIMYLVIFVQGALLSPMWCRYAEAYEKKVRNEIISLLKKSMCIALMLCGMVFMLLFLSENIVLLWFGNLDLYNYKIFFALAMLTLLRIWSSNFSTLLNGFGILKAQIVFSSIAMLLNIPASIILVKWFDYGVEGVAYGSVIALSVFAIIGPISTYKNVMAIK